MTYVSSTCKLAGLVLALTSASFISHAPANAAPSSVPMSVGQPSVMPTAMAQRMVKFQIAVPKSVPTGYQLLGASVSTAQANGAPHAAPRTKAFGYGLIMTSQSTNGAAAQVWSAPGSPAAIAGVPSNAPCTLVAINGAAYKPGPTSLADAHKTVAQAKPPVKITFKDAAGKVRTASLTHMGNFYVGGGPVPSKASGPRAALIYTSKSSSFAVIESKANPNERLAFPGQPRMEKVGDTAVIFYDTKQIPNATFVRNGVEFDIVQASAAITEDDIKRIVTSL